VFTLGVGDLLYSLTTREPKMPDARGPLLIAKPKFYDHVLFHNPGVAIITGYYGYGKTYGFGLNTYHRIRGVEVCDGNSPATKSAVIYANLSYVKDVVPGLGSIDQQLAYALWKPLTDAALYEKLRQSAQFYATFDISRLKLGEEEPPSFSEVLLELYQALGGDYTTLYIILDEFEQLSYQPSPSDVAQIINMVVKSYRSGKSVGDMVPGFLKLILLVQKAIYSEEELRRALGDSAAAGRVLKIGNRFGIPVEYTSLSLQIYLKCAVSVVQRFGAVDGDVADMLIDFFERPEREFKRYLDAMAELPGLVVFPTLINALTEALTARDPIATFVSSVVEAAKKYGVEALAKTTIKASDEEVDVDMTRALERLAKAFFGERYQVIPTKKRGYRAVVVLRDGEADVLVYRHTEVNESTLREFVEEVKKVVGDKRKINWVFLYAKPIKKEKILTILKDAKLRELKPREFYALYFAASEGLVSVEGLTRTVEEVMGDIAIELWRGR